MTPGSIVTCQHCQAQARATWTPLERPWQEGYPLLLAWTHGPHLRAEVTHVAPERCIWCHERCAALGDSAPPLYRPAPGAEPGEVVRAALAPLSPTRSTAPAAVTPPPPAPRGQLSLLL